jgi:chromosome partitioning protein
MKLITVTSYKGGVTKSTTAIHLATFLSDHGKVLLIDGDPNRTAIAWSERGELPFAVADERRAMKLISDYDYAIIDTPARPDSSDLKELAEGCDLLILPTLPDIVSLDPMLQTASDLQGANYRALIAIVPPKPNRDGETMQAELQAAGVPVFETMIRRSIGFSKAALAGKPIRDLSGGDRLPWMDYEKLGNEVLEILGA